MSNRQDQSGTGLDLVLTEQELLDFTGITKVKLSELRNAQKLPFIKISGTCRLYFIEDIITWFRTHKVTLNKGEDMEE